MPSPLRTSDWEIILNKNPDQFIEAVCLNCMYASPDAQEEVVKKHQYIFNQWLKHYDKVKNDFYLEEIRKTVRESYNQGNIDALVNLPLKKNLIGEAVDLKAVSIIIRKMREKNL